MRLSLLLVICVLGHDFRLLNAQEKAESSPHVRLLVPAYFYPAGDGLKHWDRLLAAADKVPVVAIVNPASGPGKKADANYVKLLERARKTKITLIGYVSTSYGKRTLDEVKADVERWLQLYPHSITGVFFDEQASGADKVDYYAALRTHVRNNSKLGLVVTNPGTVCDAAYFDKPATDTACVFEGPRRFDVLDFPKWLWPLPAERKAVLSYKIARVDEMRELVKLAPKRKIGYLYITDAAGDNPWDRLPKYWDEEVAAMEAVNPRKAKR